MTFKPIHDPSHLYFVTATVLGWKKLFVEDKFADVVLNSLDWHRLQNRWRLYAYVIMPNHLHAIIKPLGEFTISSLLQSFGSYTAHEILRILKQTRREDLLAFFSDREQVDSTKLYQIWKPIQAKNIYSKEFLCEKLDYIHNNPVAKGWNLVGDRSEYQYSSACFYNQDEAPIIEVDDIRGWLV